MEVRSSRRVRTLVTQMAPRGLSANEIARALISMMARSTASNQRPDTLMQDRLPPALRIFLQRTAGPYIWVNRYRSFAAEPDAKSALTQTDLIPVPDPVATCLLRTLHLPPPSCFSSNRTSGHSPRRSSKATAYQRLLSSR